MAITSELIGKLGGADVQSSDVSLAGGNRGTENFRTVTVPSGTTILVAIEGEFANSVASHQDSGIRIGGVPLGKPADRGRYLSGAKVLTSTEDIELKNDDYQDNPFTGTLYLIGL